MFRRTRRVGMTILCVLMLVVGTACTAGEQTTDDAESGDPRLVTLVPALLDAALAVGVRPVAAAVVGGEYPTHLNDDGQGIDLLDVTTGLDVERVASFAPDQILTQEADDNLADQLRQIAPTAEITFPVPAANWPEFVAQAAAELDRTEALTQVVEDHRVRVEEAKREIAPMLTGQTVTVLRMRDDGMIRVYGAESFPGSVLGSLGLTHHTFSGGEHSDQGYIDASGELLSQAVGDIVFIMQIDGEAEELLADNPLWQQLPAVREGRAFFVDQARWLHVGYQSAAALIDDSVRLLAGR